MSTRKIGLELLKMATGTKPQGHISTSRYYPANKSWTKSPAWAFEIPLSKIEEQKNGEVHLVCIAEKEGFHYLRIPNSYILENLHQFYLRKNGRISFFISARLEDIYMELRGSGNIDFKKWLIISTDE